METRPQPSGDPGGRAGADQTLTVLHGIAAGVVLVWIVMFWALPVVMSYVVPPPEVVPMPFEFAIGGFNLTWFTYAAVATVALGFFYLLIYFTNMRRPSSR